MNDKMITVLEGLIKVYEDDIKIINTFYKAFEYNENLPNTEKLISLIGTLRQESR